MANIVTISRSTVEGWYMAESIRTECFSDFVFKITLIRLILHLNPQPTDSQSGVITTTPRSQLWVGDREKLSVAFTQFGFNVRYWIHCHFDSEKEKHLNKLHCATGYWLPCSLFKFFLKLLDQRWWKFSEGYLNHFSTKLSSQIFDCCPRKFLIQEKQNGNLVITSHWIRSVLHLSLTNSSWIYLILLIQVI